METVTQPHRLTPNPPELVVDARAAGARIRIYHGRAEHWAGAEKVDLVFTNPYGDLPESLRETPMIIHQWVHRRDELARWVGVDESRLRLLGKWNGGREAFWAVNLEPFPLDIEKYRPEPGGWYPPDMVAVILSAFWMHKFVTTEELEERRADGRSFTIWDGFMGRGTLAREVIQRWGLFDYVGMEELSKHVDLALDYLKLRPEL